MNAANAVASEKQTCSRMKLMLVGQENVGKTSIGKCLLKSTSERKILKRFLPKQGAGSGGGGAVGNASQPTTQASSVSQNLSTDGIDI